MIYLLMVAMAVKHFIADAWLQKPFMYENKGKWLHPGGLLHAGIHGGFTWIVFSVFTQDILFSFFLGLMDFIIHYLVDFSKTNLMKYKDYCNKTHAGRRTTHDNKLIVMEKGLLITDNRYFYWLLGDQLAHGLTYCFLMYLSGI